jgi:FAD/FMN-containing dehydrogenase
VSSSPQPGTTLDVARLRERFDGSVTAPGDEGYDAARTVVYGGFDLRPAVIIRPTNADQVAAVIALARETGLELAVRGGGHSLAGHSVVEGGIVVDLANLKGIDIDPQGRTAWAQAGLTAGEVTAAVARHGLAAGFGDTGTVGIGGITLGGGVGFLSRKFGLTVDNLLAAEIVTADGQVRLVDADTEPDLFWALRGGGGNFGVVTRFRYRLQEMPAVVGGMLILPATPEVVHGFVAAAEAAPDELSTIANVMSAPPMPFLPPELHGRLVVLGLLCYAGPAEAGARALAPFRALAPPLADMLQPMPYAQMFPAEEGDYHPTVAGANMFLDGVDRGQAETIVGQLRASDAPMRVVQLRVLGGAVARVPAEATAYAHRDRRIMANVAAFYTGPEELPVRQAWVDGLTAALRGDDASAYVNFVAAEGPERVRDAYPKATWDRLRAVKDRYDPTNLFRRNHNIPPTGRA